MKHGANLFRQTLLILPVVLGDIRGATEWATQLLGWSPRLGELLFVILHMPVYPPGASVGWRFSFNANAPDVLNQGGLIAASGGVAAIMIALTAFFLRARRAQGQGIYNFGSLNPRGTFHDLMQRVQAVVAPRNPQFADVLIRQKAYYAC